MTNKNILFLLIIFICSCNFNKKEKQFIPPNQDVTPVEKSVKRYEKVYIAKQENSDDDFYQELSIHWISDTEIKYKLIYDNQLCAGECVGTAVQIDYEVDISENSSFTDFMEKKKNTRILIKIGKTNKDKAIATIFEGKYSSECSPYESVMLEKKN